MKMLQMIVAALCLTGCASGPNYYANAPKVDMSPQAIMGRGTCTDLPIDHNGTANPVGWSIKAPAGMQAVSCGGKYSSGAFYCADPSKCGELVVTTYPADPADRSKVWHGIVDLIGGSITACSQAANRFGFGNLDCKYQPLTVTEGKGMRGVFPGTVPPIAPGSTVQTSTTMIISIKPAGTAPITIGQVGWAESATVQ